MNKSIVTLLKRMLVHHKVTFPPLGSITLTLLNYRGCYPFFFFLYKVRDSTYEVCCPAKTRTHIC